MVVYRGWNALIKKDGTILGYCQRVTVDIAANIEPYYEINSRTPIALVEGNQEITGTIERLWVNSDLLNLVAGTSSLTEFTLEFYNTTATGGIKVTLSGCKPDAGSLEIPQDAELTESFDFRAKGITVTTV